MCCAGFSPNTASPDNFCAFTAMQFSRDGSGIVFLYHIGRCTAGGQADAGAASAGSAQTWMYLFTVAADGSGLWRVPVCDGANFTWEWM